MRNKNSVKVLIIPKVVIAEAFYDSVFDFVNNRVEQIGFVLPISRSLFERFFPKESTYALIEGGEIRGVFTFMSGVEKYAPYASIRFVVESPSVFKEMFKYVKLKALTLEKLYLRTWIYGYSKNILDELTNLGFRIGAKIPNIVSFNGELYDLIVMYYDLGRDYKFNVRRSYAKPGLYPIVDVEKAKDFSFKVRGLKKEDIQYLEKILNHPNVFRSMGRGVFEGTTYLNEKFWRTCTSGKCYALVCEDEVEGKPIGLLTIHLFSQDVLKNVGNIGMSVDARYQGLGAGTLLMEKAILLAKRIHLRNLFLTVFENNEPALKLYKKFGFKEHGKVPAWLQEGYIQEIFMTKQLE